MYAGGAHSPLPIPRSCPLLSFVVTFNVASVSLGQKPTKPQHLLLIFRLRRLFLIYTICHGPILHLDIDACDEFRHSIIPLTPVREILGQWLQLDVLRRLYSIPAAVPGPSHTP
jgi:hypothetical protein